MGIRHELATNLFRHRYCPYLIPDLGEAFIRNFPDKVDPFKDKNWSYNEHYEEVPGAIKVLVDKGYGYSEDIWADVVRPKGLCVFGDVLKKALSDVGATDISANQLLT